MCGILAYIGDKEAVPLIMDGLKRESYRGYDSSGLAVFDGKDIKVVKAVGKLEELEKKLTQISLPGTLGIGNSGWATQGEVTKENCHPHTDCKEEIYVAHNGIIENYQELKKKLLEEGHLFGSQTDTEVLPHLMEKFFQGNLEDAVRNALQYVKGTYGMVAISKKDPEKIVAARLSSPIVISINGNGGFVSSDPAALVIHSHKMIFLDDEEIAVVTKNGLEVRDIQNNKKEKQITELDWDVQEAQKGGYEHFMLKEIMEQPESIENSIRGRILAEEGRARLGGLAEVEKSLREVQGLNIIACGTSLNAGLVGEYMLEEYAGIPVDVDFASEFRYRKPIIDKDTASLFISQSGETADTLSSLKEVKEKGGLTLGIVNVVGSSITRETDAGVYNHAGPEIGVASTKAFTSQLAVLSLLTLLLGRQRQLSLVIVQRIAKEIARVPELVSQILSKASSVEALAQKYKGFENFLYIGRKYNYPVALEGALKLKEISYVHAEGYGAGEMKHGPIALIDEKFPTLVICPADSVYEKMVSNIEQIKARKGLVIALATEGNEDIKELADDVIYIPKTLEMLTPILAVIPLQLFAYHM